jgi:hypothetical protein
MKKIINILILLCDAKIYIKSRISVLFTVITDVSNKSKKIIKFKGKSEYYGFKVVMSTSEKNRKAVAWFYRTYDSPNIFDWLEFTEIFNLKEIPAHTIQFYNINKEPCHLLTINSISNNKLCMTMGNVTVVIDITSGTLLPYRYLIEFM